MNSLRLTVQDGKLSFPDKELLAQYLRSLKDGEYALTAKKKSRIRTTQQNNYIWSLYTIMQGTEDFGGWETQEIHDYLRSLFLYEVREVNGNQRKILKSTTKLTRKEFAEYVEKIKRYASIEHHIFLPDPDQYYLLEK